MADDARTIVRVAPRRGRRRSVALAALVLLATLSPAHTVDVAQAQATPLYAHYYIWFNASSWKRAKRDYPLLGRYSSDETTVMRRHVELARQAGIDGFLVSWKSTPVLDERLARLEAVARAARFKLAVVYQGLDFERRPLPAQRVARDLDVLADRYGSSPAFRGYGRPVVAWSGSWRFSPAEIERVREVVDGRLLLLATEKSVADYEAKAALFDGDLYYWSSVDPARHRGHLAKLAALGRAVHARRGLWFAPAAPGFDARLVGGRSVVDRRGGETLRRELDAAQRSAPDAIALISWNEFSENTHVEPSERYGAQALRTLADVRGTRPTALDDLDSSAPPTAASGPRAITVLLAFLALVVPTLALLRRRARRTTGELR